jgi:hypothetical protein
MPWKASPMFAVLAWSVSRLPFFIVKLIVFLSRFSLLRIIADGLNIGVDAVN